MRPVSSVYGPRARQAGPVRGGSRLIGILVWLVGREAEVDAGPARSWEGVLGRHSDQVANTAAARSSSESECASGGSRRSRETDDKGWRGVVSRHARVRAIPVVVLVDVSMDKTLTHPSLQIKFSSMRGPKITSAPG